MKSLVAIVPIRKNSQRVKRKNFRKFNKKNLLIYKIEKLKKIGKFDDIIINTDSDEAIKIAKKMNVSYHKRDSFFASSKCKNSDFWHHIAKVTDSKNIFFTNCTSPLIKISTYKKIIQLYEKNNSYLSINTVSSVKEYLYLDGKPLNFNPSKAPNSQNLPEIVKLNFAINVISRDLMLKNKSIISKKPYLYKINEIEGIDIDTMFDFNYAEFLHKKLF